MLRVFSTILAAVLALSLGATVSLAGGSHGDGHDDGHDDQRPQIGGPVVIAPMDPAAEEKARKYFTDLPVVTQDGEELRFFSDVLKGRIVVVTLFYTECTGMCPLTNQKLAEVQDMLGDAMGRDYYFVSVTLDPETDTPAVMKDYAEKFGAKDGWLFLTGNKDDIKTITRRLGQTDENIATHNPFFMLGNVPRAHWTRLPPNQPAAGIVGRLTLIAGAFAPAATSQ